MIKNSFSLKSMTAYGRGASQFRYGRFVAEIQSVNRRYLEINIALPRLFMRFEMDIRKWVTARVGRGKVHISISWKGESHEPLSITPNIALAKGIKRAWEELAKEVEVASNIDLKLLAQEKDLLVYEEELQEETVFHQALEMSLNEALDHLFAMKQQEGCSLAQDLKERIKILEELIEAIESHSGDAVEKYRQKLNKRLEALFSESFEDEERLLREIALFAERIDITEEIVRFKSHLKQFTDLLEAPLAFESETRGKTLDFLIQELNREINTIASKAAGKEISGWVITAKSELEKIREQVQNIE